MNEIKEAANSYAKGAVIGGVIMAGFALFTGRKLIMWTAIGAVAGGFVAHKVTESKSQGKKVESNFKNYDIESK